MFEERPIIVVKKKGGHGGHHGGAWKVAFADFMTAMMAFFLVMWILGLNQDARKAIAAYFNDPIGFMKSSGGGRVTLKIANESGPNITAVLPKRSKLLPSEGEGKAMEKVREAIEKALASTPEFKVLRDMVEITMTQDGLRIELLERDTPVFFETGSARIRPEAERLLKLIGKELAKLSNQIVIEGHTDSRPYAGGQAGYSNWELSSDRANAARRAMVGVLRQGQVSKVDGWADTRLRVPNRPYDASNRRVSILIATAEFAAQIRATPNAGVFERPIARPEPIRIRPTGLPNRH